MSKLIDIKDQKFGRLTAISFEDGKWNCICECLNTIKVVGGHLTNGNTKSCGCLKTDDLKERAYKLSNAKREYHPKIASARRVWKNYFYRDDKCIDFDSFLKLSQMNCVYCGVPPNTKFNYFLNKSARGSETAKENGAFVYNGIDRIDSDLHHTIDNVVTACQICNRAKNDRSTKDFLSWSQNLKTTTFKKITIRKKSLPKNGSLATSIRCVFYNHKKDTDMNVEEYYSISQMNCFYCNSLPNNIFNRAKTDKKSSKKAKEDGNYIYNGIDRIDSNKDHSKDNVVPCCYWCNFAKNNLVLSDFYCWIERIKDFQSNK